MPAARPAFCCRRYCQKDFWAFLSGARKAFHNPDWGIKEMVFFLFRFGFTLAESTRDAFATVFGWLVGGGVGFSNAGVFFGGGEGKRCPSKSCGFR